jgi:hypothetical protein
MMGYDIWDEVMKRLRFEDGNWMGWDGMFGT